MQKPLVLTFLIAYMIFGWIANQHLNQMEYLCRFYAIEISDFYATENLKLIFRLLYIATGIGFVFLIGWRNNELEKESKC